MTHRFRTLLALGLALGAVTGCKKKEPPPPPAETATPAPAPAPLAVSAITIGNKVDRMNMVMTPMTTLGTRDTIYASVTTTGKGENATIGAIWEFVKADGSTVKVNESSQTITTNGGGSDYTAFQIAKASPWPAGKYRVTVSLNGVAAQPAEFEVK